MGVTFRVTMDMKTSALMKKLQSRGWHSAVRKEMNAAVAKGAKAIQDGAKQNIARKFGRTPGNYTDGRLKNGIRPSVMKVKHDRGQLAAWIWPNVISGRIHEFGGDIWPVRKKMLSWLMPASKAQRPSATALRRRTSRKSHRMAITEGPGLVRVFAKHVRIPPRPYLLPAMRDARPQIMREFREAAARCLGVK